MGAGAKEKLDSDSVFTCVKVSSEDEASGLGQLRACQEGSRCPEGARFRPGVGGHRGTRLSTGCPHAGRGGGKAPLGAGATKNLEIPEGGCVGQWGKLLGAGRERKAKHPRIKRGHRLFPHLSPPAIGRERMGRRRASTTIFPC